MARSTNRILFDVRPSYGHVYPLLPMATACRDAGHEVHFATSDDFVSRLRRLGFITHRAGISMAEAERRMWERHPEFAVLPREEMWRAWSSIFGEMLPGATYDALTPLLATIEPGFVVYDECDAGASLAARDAGIPAVCHALGRQFPDAIRKHIEDVLAATWPGRSDDPFSPFATDAYIDICPPSVRDPSAGEPPLRITRRPVASTDGSDGVPEWVTQHRTRPLIYVTLGTVVFEAVESLRAAVAGLARLDVDVLVTVGPRGDVDALGPLPERVHAERFVPQDALLPFVDLAIHHCGSGTMLGALAQGIPQLVMPHGADQYTNAEVIDRSGAGRRLLREEITAEAVAGIAHALLTEPTYRGTARRIAREIAAMPSPDDVVPQLIEYADRARPAARTDARRARSA